MLDEKLRKYTITMQSVYQRLLVPISPMCNGLTVINIGTTLAMVGDIPLHPGTPGTNNGESWSFGGNLGELFDGIIDITFPAGNTGRVLVIQKIYK